MRDLLYLYLVLFLIFLMSLSFDVRYLPYLLVTPFVFFFNIFIYTRLLKSKSERLGRSVEEAKRKREQHSDVIAALAIATTLALWGIVLLSFLHK